MSKSQPVTQTLEISDVRGQLNALVDQVYRNETRVVVEKSGVPVAGLVSAEDVQRLHQLDQLERQSDFAVLDELRKAFAGVPAGEIEQETDRITSDIRAEGQRQRDATARP